MKKRILDNDIERGVKNIMWKEDGKMIVQTVQDLEPHLKNAKELRKISDNTTNKGLFCTIPSHFIDLWSQELPAGARILSEEYREFLKEKINSPEFAKFRLKEGKI